MRLIHKKNVIPVICITYTAVSIAATLFEVVAKGEMNPTQLNIFLFLLLSVLGVAVLSQHYRLERFSPLAMIGIQYLAAIAVIWISLKAASCFTDVHPDGFKDMTVSFSILYFVGAVFYYICLRLEVRRQNRILERIRQNIK